MNDQLANEELLTILSREDMLEGLKIRELYDADTHDAMTDLELAGVVNGHVLAEMNERQEAMQRIETMIAAQLLASMLGGSDDSREFLEQLAADCDCPNCRQEKDENKTLH